MDNLQFGSYFIEWFGALFKGTFELYL